MATHDPDALIRLFARLAARQLRQEDFHAWAGVVKAEREKGFRGSYGPDGQEWAPLADGTIRQKMKGGGRRKKAEEPKRDKRYKHSTVFRKQKQGVFSAGKASAGNPADPLIDTGDLMRPTIGATSKRGWVRLAKSRSDAVSGDDSISMIHDKGLGNNPRRHHWGIYESARKIIVSEFEKKIADVLRSLGF